MKYETLLTEIINSVQIIKMNRPEKLNAWIPLMGQEMTEVIDQANNCLLYTSPSPRD